MGKKSVDLSVEMILGMVRTLGVRGVATALNNAFYHGKILKEVYDDCDQAILDLIFEGIEKFVEAAAALEK